jgi:hypothetical protein
MPKPMHLALTMVLLAGCLTGCDAQRWVSAIKTPLAASAKRASTLSPSYSLSGRVEARLLSGSSTAR